jgi:4-amino-4-deoxychorismate lyase
MPRTALAFVNQPSAFLAAHRPGTGAFWFADPDLPQLNVRDLGATRGDGVFETISIVRGVPNALEAHLSRFTSSATVLDLPAPDLPVWRQAITAVIERMDPVPEAFVRAVLTRGIEGELSPTGWVYAAASPDHSAARASGVGVALLDRGLRHDVQRTSPWLLSGAKTLSYALNRAALREAGRRGADDVLFVSSDGFVLEGPTASLVYLSGDRLCTPATGLGILEGTTQGDIFEWARTQARETGFESLTRHGFLQVDAAWLVSSGRLAVPIHTVDGLPFPVRTDLTEQINAYLLARTPH